MADWTDAVGYFQSLYGSHKTKEKMFPKRRFAVELYVKYRCNNNSNDKEADPLPNIKPVSDLRNDNEVLRDTSEGKPVFLTKNGRGKYAILDIHEYERMRVSIELMSRLSVGEQNAKEKGLLSVEELEEEGLALWCNKY